MSRISAHNTRGMMSEQSWRVLHVIANHEKRVEQHLTIRSVECFLPQYQEKSRWSDRTVVLQRPLFPGYLFARFPRESKYLVLTTPGILNVLGNDQTACLQTSEVERIRAALILGYPLKPHPPVSCGTAVRIRSGIFDGISGIVAELRRNCKVIIRLTPVDRCFSVELSLDDVELLSNDAPWQPIPVPSY